MVAREWCAPPDVDEDLFRLHVAAAVAGQDDDELRLALTAALERGDASVHELPAGYLGVKVAGAQLLRVHRSRLRRPEAN